MNQINRREFLVTAAGIAVPVALVAAPKEELPPKKVFWNLEEFDERVSFQPGELALVYGRRREADTFLWHAARHHKMPSALIDCRGVMDSCDEAKAWIEVYRKVKVFCSNRMLWPKRLCEIKPGTAVFVSNSHPEWFVSFRTARQIAVERNLAVIVDVAAVPNLSMMRSADLVLTVEKEEIKPFIHADNYLKVNILKNRNGPNNQSFWYKSEAPYFMNSTCAAWC